MLDAARARAACLIGPAPGHRVCNGARRTSSVACRSDSTGFLASPSKAFLSWRDWHDEAGLAQLRCRRPARRPTRRRRLLRNHQGANTPPPLPPSPNETVDARARDIIMALIGRIGAASTATLIPIPIPIAPSPSKKRVPSNLATDGRHYEQYEDQRPSGM